MMKPWDIVGWLVAGMIVFILLVLPPFVIWANAERRRAMARFDRDCAEVRRGLRPLAPPPAPPGASPPPPPSK